MRALHSALAVSFLLLSSAIAPAVAGDAGAAAAPAFEQDRYVEHRGDVVAVALDVPRTTTELSLQFPTETVTVSVQDGGDGEVVLRLNTFAGTWSAGDETDHVTVVSGTTPAMPAPGRYRMVLGDGTNESSAVLELRPRSLERIEPWQGSANLTLAGPPDVRERIHDGQLRRATGLNESHVLVLELEASGLEGAIAAADGRNATARFRSVLSTHGAVQIRQYNWAKGPEEYAAVLHILDGPGVHVYPDTANDTYYLVVDVVDARITAREDGPVIDDTSRRVADPIRFRVQVELLAESPLTEETERAVAPISDRKAGVVTAQDGIVHLHQRERQTIRGPVNVALGSNVTVVLATRNGSTAVANESITLTKVVAVEPIDEDEIDRSHLTPYPPGMFEATFDLSNISTEAGLTIDVRFEGSSLLPDPVPVNVTDSFASLAIKRVGTSGENQTVVVNASLSDGGFAVLHEDTPNGPVVGRSGYLSPGTHVTPVDVVPSAGGSDVVVVAHRDTNHNEQFDGVTVDVPYESETWTERTTLSVPTALVTNTPSTSTDRSTQTKSTAPGFGATVAILAGFAVLSGLVFSRRS